MFARCVDTAQPALSLMISGQFKIRGVQECAGRTTECGCRPTAVGGAYLPDRVPDHEAGYHHVSTPFTYYNKHHHERAAASSVATTIETCAQCSPNCCYLHCNGNIILLRLLETSAMDAT